MTTTKQQAAGTSDRETATATEFAGTAGNAESRLFQRPGIAAAPDVAAHAYESMLDGEVLAVHGLAMQSVRLSPRAVLRSVVAAVNSKPE